MNSGVKASIEEEDNENLEEDEFSVDVHTLCHPGRNIFVFTQKSKGIRQWLIHSCTSPMMYTKLTLL